MIFEIPLYFPHSKRLRKKRGNLFTSHTGSSSQEAIDQTFLTIPSHSGQN